MYVIWALLALLDDKPLLVVIDVCWTGLCPDKSGLYWPPDSDYDLTELNLNKRIKSALVLNCNINIFLALY